MAKKEKKKGSGFFRFLRRLLLVILTAAVMLATGSYILLNQVFNGPSPAARNAVTVSMTQSEYTEWIPGIFLSDRQISEICGNMTSILPANVSDPALITPGSSNDDWAADPSGIRMEQYRGEGFHAYIMIVRDPGQVSLSYHNGGDTIRSHMDRTDAAAAVNAGAFRETDDASHAQGLVISNGSIVSDTGAAPVEGFAGFNHENVLIVAGSMTAAEAQSLGIRDGCAYGPVLIMNGQINEGAYNANSGFSSRACIGQRKDGSVVFLYITGPASGDAGASRQDCIDILYEYGCVNACSLDSGSAAMLCRDAAGEIQTTGSDSPLRSESEMMPGVWIVRSGEED